MKKLADILVPVGYAALGTGLILRGFDERREARAGLAPGADASSLGRAGGQQRFAQTDLDVKDIRQRVKLIAKFVRAGGRNAQVHMCAKGILSEVCGDTWCVPEKNWEAEADALFRAMKTPTSCLGMRYTRDMLRSDTFVHPKHGAKYKGGDCLPAGTMLLTQHGTVPIEDVEVGATIMGDGDWVKVTNWWSKGTKPLIEFQMAGGGWGFQCTPDHKLFVGTRDEHHETRAGDVAVGDALLRIERPQYGRVEVIRPRAEAPVYDIETSSHRFYLPEHDLIVHNCDDMMARLGAALESVGHVVKLRVIQTVDSDDWDHIYLLVGLPPDGPTTWKAYDPSENVAPGWQVRGAEQSARSGRPSGDVVRVMDFDV